MYFEFIKNAKIKIGNSRQDFSIRNDLYKKCQKVETYVCTYPDLSIVSVRQALEMLVQGILIDNRQSTIDNQTNQTYTLYEMIKNCKAKHYIGYDEAQKLHELRIDSNKYVHVEIEENGVRQYVLKEEPISVDTICGYVQKLYDVLKSIFNYDGPVFRKEYLPIGNYEIERAIETDVADRAEYIGKYENDGVVDYAYIRVFAKIDDAQAESKRIFYERDGFAQRFINSMDQDAVHIISGRVLETSDKCDKLYVIYTIKKNTVTLDSFSQQFEKKDALDITLQITRGLLSLLQGGEKVHHRGIRPNHIFITPAGQGYNVKLGGFETAKIESASVVVGTVGEWAVERMGGNWFIPDEIRKKDMEEIQGIDWEKVDAYSMAALLAYCLDNSSVKDTIEEEVFDDFSDDLYNVLHNILANSINQKPSLAELEKALSKEEKLL